MKTNTLILSLVFCLIPARPILAQTQEPLPDERVMVEKEANPASSTVSESLKKKVLQTYGRLPLTFEANHGQTDASVDFLARGDGYNLFLTSTEVVLVLHKSQIAEPEHTAESASTTVGREETEATELTVVRMKLIGANPATELTALEELASKSNYFIGNDPKKWHTNVPTYSKVARPEVYPGIDLVFYGNQRELEYDFVVAADADPKVIRMAFEGTEQLGIDASGDLILNVPGGEIRLRKPVAYQEQNGLREPVVVSYALKGTNEVAFAVSAYDVDRPLIIDPVLSYSTFLGGRGGADGINAAVTADSDGFIYVTGATSASTAFPISLGAFQRFRKGNNDTFVTKLDPSVPGFAGLVYSTFLGGSRQNESAFGIAVDNNGNASVTGRTLSDDFPTTPSAFQRGPSIVGFHAYVTVLNSSGSGLVYSTYLRGSTSDSGNAIAVDDSGNVYVTGTTSSSNFPNKNAVQPVFGGGTDAFVAKLDPTAFGADSLVYSTFLGDGGDDSGNGIAVDSSGAVYVSGDTTSANFSLAGGTCQMIGSGGDGDAFVTKLDAAGSVLTYCTFLGGVELDMATGIAVDNGGAAYIAGLTNSADFPIEGTFGTVFGGKGRFGIGDAFVAKLDADGSALNYSLFLGGSDRDFATGVAVDGSGAAYVVGTTRSDNFPVKDPLPGQGSLNRFNDAFVAKLDPTGSGLVYSTYLGGSQGGGSTFGNAISVDSSGAAYVVGETFADDFPTTPDAFQPIFRPASFGRSSSEAFVSKITSAPELELRAGFGSGPSDPDTETTSVTKGVETIARFPLGSKFFIQVAAGNSEPIESIFTLETAMIDPPISEDEDKLFPNNVVIEFDRATASKIKFFQAVHLGNVILNIKPTDTSSDPVKVEIEVIQPEELGDVRSQFDALFIEAGHRSGIPPQLLKGVALRESGPNFDPLSYRYELMRDLEYMSRGSQNLRRKLPYSLYRLATAADTEDEALDEGSDLMKPEDIERRSEFFIVRGGMLGNIEDDDLFVSALEIFEQNDSFFGVKDPNVSDQNWSNRRFSKKTVLDGIEKAPETLEFTAQTSLTGSFGIMQVLYPTAIRPLNWKGIKSEGACHSFPEDCNPSYLFDTPENIARGGGTLKLASDLLIIGFIEHNSQDLANNPEFGQVSLLEEAFGVMLKKYNSRDTYPQDVLDFADMSLPRSGTSVFP